MRRFGCVAMRSKIACTPCHLWASGDRQESDTHASFYDNLCCDVVCIFFFFQLVIAVEIVKIYFLSVTKMPPGRGKEAEL